MKDEDKSKNQLLKELKELRKHTTKFEKLEAEHKRAEEALRESEERFRQFFENEPEYCYMISHEGTILDVNKAALKTLGYQKNELLGKPLRDVKNEIDRLGRPLAPQSIEAIDKLLEKHDASTFDEEQFIHEELRADAVLYRDPRFLEGLSAQLEQRVPDFRLP